MVVAQISDLPYRRSPIGKPPPSIIHHPQSTKPMNPTQNPTISSIPITTSPVEPSPRKSASHPDPLHSEGRGDEGGERVGHKISRLPKPTRAMINLMLEDGLPYKVIIDELAEAGRGITPQSLTKWLQSGYEDYLKNRQNIEEAKTQAEFSADLLRELGDVDVSTIHRACLMLTSLQIFNAIDEYGDETLREALHVNPGSYFTMLNALCNLTNSAVKLEDHRITLESAATKVPAAPRPATTQIKSGPNSDCLQKPTN